MEELSAAERQGIIASLDEETAAAVLAELDERFDHADCREIGSRKAADISLEEMAPKCSPNRGRTQPTCPGRLPRKCWKRCPARGSEVRGLLAFRENTAGGMCRRPFLDPISRQSAWSTVH